MSQTPKGSTHESVASKISFAGMDLGSGEWHKNCSNIWWAAASGTKSQNQNLFYPPREGCLLGDQDGEWAEGRIVLQGCNLDTTYLEASLIKLRAQYWLKSFVLPQDCCKRAERKTWLNQHTDICCLSKADPGPVPPRHSKDMLAKGGQCKDLEREEGGQSGRGRAGEGGPMGGLARGEGWDWPLAL